MEHTFRFKTNIKCNGCVATVQPTLDAEKAITSWAVATTEPDKILTVNSESLSEEEIINLVKLAGFKAESL
ncbi:hypothetical protein DBR32_08010 [Taibaiella sp. KBW10]|uniref:heavy-metal-associated domain-containing protein n=1 Tax=Taibaiella sp. KBW10 TaxID=2153357 RepID=UPI000F594EF9|nr:hypothetical protein [Taibaiella sp. KBW10]RQO30667.1 hypothetical protein DBR32_08010 [Taibaiella sp. KBW10]